MKLSRSSRSSSDCFPPIPTASTHGLQPWTNHERYSHVRRINPVVTSVAHRRTRSYLSTWTKILRQLSTRWAQHRVSLKTTETRKERPAHRAWKIELQLQEGTYQRRVDAKSIEEGKELYLRQLKASGRVPRRPSANTPWCWSVSPPFGRSDGQDEAKPSHSAVCR